MMLLHISDLHFGNKNRFSDDPPGEIGNAFCRALKIAADKVKTDSDISLAIVTGDLSESGLPSQFRYARDFLHSIGEYFSIGLDRFVILPGNHDISWSDCQMVRAGLEGEKFPKHEFDRRLNAEKLSNYRNFLSDFYGAPVTNEALAGLADARPLERGGWLRDFPTLRLSLHLRGELTEDELQKAEQASESVGSALGRRNLCSLRGWWLSDSENWKPARDCLSEALSLAHKVGKTDRRTEVRLALARFRLGEDVSVQEIADQVENTADVLTHLPLALLWLATGDAKKAESHALAAYKHAWADGAPYFHQYECSRAREILAQIGVMPPQLPAYRFETRDILAWEPQVARMIELQKVRHQRPTTEDG